MGRTGGERNSMMILSTDKCPKDTVKWTYEFWIGLLFCGNDKGLIMAPHVLSSLI